MPQGPFEGQRAVLATMHGKLASVAPPLASALGLRVVASEGLDTDRFGTFSGEVPRAGDQKAAAIAKAQAALALHDAPFALASEGAFGPHPTIPWVGANVELLVLLGRKPQELWCAWHLSTETNHTQRVVATWEDALALGEEVGFPTHGLVVHAGPLASDGVLAKGLRCPEALKKAFTQARQGKASVLIATDMRAHQNPTRQKNIQAAAGKLAALLQSLCGGCGWPGFGPTALLRGRPCSHCAGPTPQPVAEVWTCQACGHQDTHPLQEAATGADPGDCPRCNP